MSKFVAIDEESNDEIVHALRLGKTQRAADKPLDPRPQIDMLALDFLCVLLAHLMLHGIEMARIGPPAIGKIARDTQGLQECFALYKNRVLPSSEHLRQDLPCVVINGVPQPAGVRFATHVTPHFIQF